MKKISAFIFVGVAIAFPLAVFAKPCSDAVADSGSSVSSASCSAGCSGGTQPVTPLPGQPDYECPAGTQCCGMPSGALMATPDVPGAGKAELEAEAMCTCSLKVTPKSGAKIIAGQGFKVACNAYEGAAKLAGEDGVTCTCSEDSGTCTRNFTASQSACEQGTAKMQETANGSLLSSVADISEVRCSSAATQAAVKPQIKAKACVPKAVAKAGIGQLDLSGVNSCCISNGDCTLDDIVTTGAAFANLLTQLSAAFFFAAFVYGGAMYLLSFGDKGRVDKGKKAITGAAIGMLIVLMAWTIVNYIANALKGKT